MANCRLHLSGCNHGGMTGGLATMTNCKLLLSECSNCVHPLMLKRSQHTVWSCIKKPQPRLRLETSCSLKKDASFEEQGTPIGNVNGIHVNVPLRLGTLFEGEMQKIEEPPTCSEVRDVNGTLVAPESRVATPRDTNGTLVAPESRVATASDTNGPLVASEDTNGTLVAPESLVATARDMNGTPIGDTNGTLVAPESFVATIRDTNGTLFAPESRMAIASDTNGMLVASEDMNGTLVAPECHVATARDMNGTLVAAESRVATARIDWLGMSNEEFKKRIKEMAQSPLPRSHLMSEGEFGDFCIRREEMLYQAGKMVSKFYQDVDLPAQLRQLRGEQLNTYDTAPTLINKLHSNFGVI